MASLTTYMGLRVLSGSPMGPGGAAINQDLKNLVMWNPQSSWGNGAAPNSTDNESIYFYPGSFWSVTGTPPQLFVCTSSSSTTATWAPVLMAVEQDTAPVLGGNLDANNHNISNVAHIGMGISADSTTGIHLSSTLTGNITARAVYVTPTFGTDVQNPICVIATGEMSSGGMEAESAFTYRADDWAANAVTIDNLFGFYCSSLTVGVTNYGFYGLVSGSGNWNLYMSGNAPNYLNGSLLIGTMTSPGSGRYLALGTETDLVLSEGDNIDVGTVTGTKIGTGITQKLGFWNANPVAQYGTTGTTVGFTGGTASTVTKDATFTGNIGSSNAYTIGDIVRALKLCGIIG